MHAHRVRDYHNRMVASLTAVADQLASPEAPDILPARLNFIRRLRGLPDKPELLQKAAQLAAAAAAAAKPPPAAAGKKRPSGEAGAEGGGSEKKQKTTPQKEKQSAAALKPLQKRPAPTPQQNAIGSLPPPVVLPVRRLASYQSSPTRLSGPAK